MSWFRCDDTLHDHPKWVGILAEARNRRPGDRAAARALAKDAAQAWFGAGIWGSGTNCDGIVPETAAATIAPRVFLTEDEFLDAAELLVAAGLWHRFTGSRVPRCSCTKGVKVTGTGWVVHDWSTYQIAKQQVVKTESREKRRKALYNSVEGREVLEAVKRRDGSHCRYCWTEVRWNDRKSSSAATVDHLDPDGPNSVDNCVVACRSCNSAKGERTPEEAGMQVKQPYWGDTQDLAGSGREQSANGRGLVRAGGTGRVGSGRIGSDRVRSGVSPGPFDDALVDPLEGVSVLDQRLRQDGLLDDEGITS